ncbi:MAG: deoxyribodipyrimidine photo-lyase [Saprospiraceae bacterium]
MEKRENRVSVFWFRRDLRLFDNHGLFQALNGNSKVLPIFIFDKNILETLTDKKDKRVSFIHHNLLRIENELNKLGSSLWVIHDTPLAAFQLIFSTFDVSDVYTNHDYEPYAIARDKEISDFLSAKNISFHTSKDQVIFEKDEVMKNDGKPYTIFTPYSKVWKQKLMESKITFYESENHLTNLLAVQKFRTPLLEEMGFELLPYHMPSTTVDEEIISHYDQTRNFPAIRGTSQLSVHLRFGTVSIRKLVAKANELNEQWLNELIWREFFMMILYQFPRVIKESFKKKYENILWRNNENEFDLWCKGQTGYPIVDAGMREMNETGLMHNRVRMIVASFLTKHLLIDWRWGEAYFAEKLLDYELSSNNGNWQWSAGCGCDAAPYFRIFNPEEQTKKFDPELKYIRKWIKDYRSEYLTPIVEHSFARKRALDIYKISIADGSN